MSGDTAGGPFAIALVASVAIQRGGLADGTEDCLFQCGRGEPEPATLSRDSVCGPWPR